MDVKVHAAPSRAINERERTVRHLISTAHVDRDGEVLIPTGCNYKSFLERNPSVFWNHKSLEPPIGRCLSLRCADDGLEAVTRFAGLEQAHPDAERLWLLTKDGFLSSWSVGFTVDEASPERVHPSQRGRTVKRWTLLEYSLTGVPSNEFATVRLAKALRLPDGATARDLEKALGRVPVQKFWSLARPIAVEAAIDAFEREALIETVITTELERLAGRR